MKTRKVKTIKIDIDKCTGCRSCEMSCSAFHAIPKYSGINPAKSRIQVIVDELRDIYVPLRAGEYTQAECLGRHTYTIKGKEFNECSFCGASCPSRILFKEPNSHLPLKCDMCEDEPPLSEPMCVQACQFGALVYEEKEEQVEEEPKTEKRLEMEIGLESLIDKYGLKTVKDTLTRISKE